MDDLEGNIAEQAGGAVESTFCSGWVGGQEETLRPCPGLPRGHLDRGNTRSVPGQTWSSTLTHMISHTLSHTHTMHAARLYMTIRQTHGKKCVRGRISQAYAHRNIKVEAVFFMYLMLLFLFQLLVLYRSN